MIPKALYDRYKTALLENDRQCRLALAELVNLAGEVGIDDLRDLLLSAYPELVRLYGTRAAKVASEYYMELRSAQNVSTPYTGAVAAGAVEAYVDSQCEEAIEDVRREIGAVYKGESTREKLANKLKGLATKRTMEASSKTLTAYAKSDPARPMYALVASPGACAWCVIVSSRGFSNTKSAIEHMRHDHCRCVPVVDFDRKNPALEGYDPDALYDMYRDVYTDENNAAWSREWNSMSKDERDAYEGGRKRYMRNRLIQELNVSMGRNKGSIASRSGSRSYVRANAEQRTKLYPSKGAAVYLPRNHKFNTIMESFDKVTNAAELEDLVNYLSTTPGKLRNVEREIIASKVRVMRAGFGK